jgi:hypothetical protein
MSYFGLNYMKITVKDMVHHLNFSQAYKAILMLAFVTLVGIEASFADSYCETNQLDIEEISVYHSDTFSISYSIPAIGSDFFRSRGIFDCITSIPQSLYHDQLYGLFIIVATCTTLKFIKNTIWNIYFSFDSNSDSYRFTL